MDDWLLRFINQTLASPLLDAVMPLVSTAGLAACVGLGAALCIGAPPRRRLGAAILAALLAGLLLVLATQYLVLRPRPDAVRLVGLAPNFPSFPSGHAMAGFATAIGIHPAIGYNSVTHLAPAYLGALMFMAGIILWRPGGAWQPGRNLSHRPEGISQTTPPLAG